jgi:CRP-like cAMP-binding protein
MDKSNLESFINKVVPISPVELKYISDSFVPVKFDKGEVILKKGAVSDDYIYLQSGLIRSFLYDLNGEEVTTDFFVENSIVFEITSFFNRIPTETNMVALTNCRGFKLTYEQLNKLFHDKPSFREFGRAILVKEFIASKNRNYSIITKTAEQRYQQLMNEKPPIILHAPLKHIASYLGITDSTLSRIRSKFYLS